jgi:uncharacterized protein (TIGR00304 family)
VVALERVLGPTLLVAGALVIVAAVRTGAATLTLLVFIPVVSGSSFLLVLGVVLLIGGFVTLPLLWYEIQPQGSESFEVAPADGARSTSSRGSSGGLVLIGPIPIFFGAWKSSEHRTLYWVAVAVGVLLTLLAVALVLSYRG